MTTTALERLDHLVYAVHDVDAAIDDLATRLGVRASLGGPHPGRGTRNALLALETPLGATAYLEIVGPDDAQPEMTRWLGVARDAAPRLSTWAVRASSLDAEVARLRAAGVPIGAARTGARVRSDGTRLSWRLTDPEPLAEGGVVPFLIDWGDSPHPAASAPRGVSLVSISAWHPEPPRIRSMLRALGCEIDVAQHADARLGATLVGPGGRVSL